MKTIALKILDNPEDYSASEIITILTVADSLFHNDEESFLTDSEYDALRIIAYSMEPHNIYFTGVGSEVRGGKIKLPYSMGSLNQIEIGDIEQWIKLNDLLNQRIISTDKLDGVSGMVVYDDSGKMQIGYSRGNGTEGADITRHLSIINSVPSQTTGSMVVRGELIISKANFEKVQKIKSRNGNPYKNARNMIAGLMNSKVIDPSLAHYIDFVAYDIKSDNNSKVNQLMELSSNGFQVPWFDDFSGNEITDDMLATYLTNRREGSEYEIDGLVLDVDSSLKRSQMTTTKDTLNPSYSIKYKVADASNIAVATVIGVKLALSKHGYIKPRIEIEPIELVGVTITFCTGFNMKYIYDNKIQPGCKINITRSGDVIPLILGVTEPGRLK